MATGSDPGSVAPFGTPSSGRARTPVTKEPMRNLPLRTALLSTLFVTLGLARSANAAPLVVYSSWQNDPNPPPVGRLNGAFFQYCDMNVHEADKYGCVPDFDNELGEVPVGGIAGGDVNA